MLRTLHRWPGLVALVLLTLLALSGAALSVFPMAERLAAPQAGAGQSVADLAARVASLHPGLEEIRRAPSGRLTAWWFDNGVPGSAVIDPLTGAGIGLADPDPLERWLTNLHRSLFLDDAGRLVMAAGAMAMLLLALSGAALVARRAGGWRHWFAPLRGPFAGRLHTEVARIAVFGLSLSAATALWMTASTFDLLPDGALRPSDPVTVSGQTDAPLDQMAALRDVPLASFRKLGFPDANDAQDVFTLSTDAGVALIDQGTGGVLSFAPLTPWQRISETMFMLHTGQGAALLGLVLGLIALGVPVLGGTGALIWVAGRRGRVRLRGMVPADRAQTVILVGSDGGSTWGFAATLARALQAGGHPVHVAPMSAFDPARCPRAKQFLILTATYGAGAAPASAKGFLDRLATLTHAPTAPFAVLGFGDRSFPAFCAFAAEIDTAAQTKGWARLLPMDSVNRQSPQDFARWGRALGVALDLPLALDHQPAHPAADSLTLISRREYGAAVQAPAAILRFALPKATLWARLTGRGFARFQAGDLIGILPQGSPLPRLYSLASGSSDGFVEIVVKEHPGGLCSGQLAALAPGDDIQGFLRRNPGFHAGRGRAPLILIGAGTGIGPLAGFIRANARHRPVHLFFGMRDPDSDFFYSEDLALWRARGQVSALTTATSRGAQPRHVQDMLRAEGAQVAQAVRAGAKIMVCGGRDMAQGVGHAMQDILAPMGLTLATLQAGGRYVEDIY